MTPNKPEILAPAGNLASFAAAVAAGADAVYCGLKNYSARMEADNFSMEELAGLVPLAHDNNVKVYVAINSMIKPGDLQRAANLMDKLARHVKPDAVIVADPAFCLIAKKTGFKGELHLSTLANLTFPAGLKTAAKMGFSRVVLPRELNVDEIKQMATGCPEKTSLEVFIHGALCYGVSGRCYWSSWYGGKSGLRGRCVQPCRRVYEAGNTKERLFSCQDLSLDVLVKVLGEIDAVKTWKIEGRKKGPHYVYYTVKAYKMLRDQGNDPAVKKNAIALLGQALGRPATHYGFLPQRPQNPVSRDQHTGSGRFIGAISGPRANPFIKTAEALLAGDLLRIGYEDAIGHQIYKVRMSVPKRGTLNLRLPKSDRPDKNTPVFLIDRREPELNTIIAQFETQLARHQHPSISPSETQFTLGSRKKKWRGNRISEVLVERMPDKKNTDGQKGLWVSDASVNKVPGRFTSSYWWWLPPVIWPEQQEAFGSLIASLLRKGATKFVLNAPWQISFFRQFADKTPLKRKKSPGFPTDKIALWAGPFCNIANEATVEMLSREGFRGVIVSPELSGETLLNFPARSALPVGILLTANWPLTIARTLGTPPGEKTLFQSPKGETAIAVKQDDTYFIYPDWQLNLTKKKKQLEKAGYTLFVHLEENLGKQYGFHMKKRNGIWNWDLKLL